MNQLFTVLQLFTYRKSQSHAFLALLLLVANKPMLQGSQSMSRRFQGHCFVRTV